MITYAGFAYHDTFSAEQLAAENAELSLPWSASDVDPGAVIDCDGTLLCRVGDLDTASLIATAVNNWRDAQ